MKTLLTAFLCLILFSLSAQVTITKSSLGLPKVDNTADTEKPVSIKQRAALDSIKNQLALLAAKPIVSYPADSIKSAINAKLDKAALDTVKIQVASIAARAVYPSDSIKFALNAKADKTSVTASLNTKANSTDVTGALSLKANSTDVTSMFSQKADKVAMTAALLLKADKNYVDSVLQNIAKTIPALPIRDLSYQHADSVLQDSLRTLRASVAVLSGQQVSLNAQFQNAISQIQSAALQMADIANRVNTVKTMYDSLPSLSLTGFNYSPDSSKTVSNGPLKMTEAQRLAIAKPEANMIVATEKGCFGYNPVTGWKQIF